jgi:hypothetical protein
VGSWGRGGVSSPGPRDPGDRGSDLANYLTKKALYTRARARKKENQDLGPPEWTPPGWHDGGYTVSSPSGPSRSDPVSGGSDRRNRSEPSRHNH